MHELSRKLDDILEDLAPLERLDKAKQFLDSTQNLNMLCGLIADIHDVVMDYQVCPQSARSQLT